MDSAPAACIGPPYSAAPAQLSGQEIEFGPSHRYYIGRLNEYVRSRLDRLPVNQHSVGTLEIGDVVSVADLLHSRMVARNQVIGDDDLTLFRPSNHDSIDYERSTAAVVKINPLRLAKTAQPFSESTLFENGIVATHCRHPD